MGKARELAFIRDTEGGNFLNRLCRDPLTKVFYVSPHLTRRKRRFILNVDLAKRSLFIVKERLAQCLPRLKHVKKSKELQQSN